MVTSAKIFEFREALHIYFRLSNWGCCAGGATKELPANLDDRPNQPHLRKFEFFGIPRPQNLVRVRAAMPGRLRIFVALKIHHAFRDFFVQTLCGMPLSTVRWILGVIKMLNVHGTAVHPVSVWCMSAWPCLAYCEFLSRLKSSTPSGSFLCKLYAGGLY